MTPQGDLAEIKTMDCTHWVLQEELACQWEELQDFC